MVVGGGSRWWWVVVGGGGRWWYIRIITLYSYIHIYTYKYKYIYIYIYEAERRRNNNNYNRVPGAAWGSEKSGSSNQRRYNHGREKKETHNINVVIKAMYFDVLGAVLSISRM